MTNIPQSPPPKAPLKTSPMTPITYAGYTEVTLNRRVVVQGHAYLPGIRHVVDQDTLKALGDAVINAQPAR